MTEICEVVVTGDDVESLISMTKELISRRLVACGQHVSTIRSVYRWDGKLNDDTEARVMLHTRQELVSCLIDVIKAEHSYDVPCILATPIQEANPDYVQWVYDETRS